LLESLSDPRFNVRFEAIVSVARMMPDERLIKALVDILHSDEPAFSVIAAWALGRIGDSQAVEPLRRALDSKYRSVKAHSTIALGTLGDKEMIPQLIKRLREEPDQGLKLAYASALGMLKVQEAAPMLLELLCSTRSESSQEQLGLSLARIIGEEGRYIHLLRQWKTEPGTVASQIMNSVKKGLAKGAKRGSLLLDKAEQCRSAFSREDLALAFRMLGEIIELAPKQGLSPSIRSILRAASTQLREGLDPNPTYVLLALHGMEVGYK
jgi:HEAT repeat protein